MTDLMSEIFASGLFAGIETALQSGRDVNLSNVQSGLEGFLALAVLNRLGKTVLYLAPSDRDALSISKKFIKADPKHVFYYPAEPAHAYFSDAVSRDIPYQRVDVLMHLLFGDDMMIVTTPEALLKKIKAPEQFAKSAVMLQKGDTVDPEALVERLSSEPEWDVIGTSVHLWGLRHMRWNFLTLPPRARGEAFDDYLWCLERLRGLGIALVLFIDIRIQKWLELDFEELDNALNSTDRKIEKAKSSAVTRFVDKDTGREITTLSGDPDGKFIVGDNVVTLKPHRDMFGRIIPPNTAGKVVKVYASKVDVLFKIDSVNTTVQFNKDEVIKRFY